MNPTIQTHSGIYFNFLEPHKSEFTIDDIAHALAHICRFTGHTREFYSVAQHSVHVSYLVPSEDALAGLLHDAHEAFVGDVASPLKHLLPEYKLIEERAEQAVRSRYGLPTTLPASVKHADLLMLATERHFLMPDTGSEHWALIDGLEPALKRLVPVAPETARHLFLARYRELIHTQVAPNTYCALKMG